MANTAAWSTGSAAGCGAVVRLTRQQPSMSLRAQGELELRAGRIIKRLLKLHDRHGRLIAASGTAIGPPGRFVRAVDQQGDRPRAFLPSGCFCSGSE